MVPTCLYSRGGVCCRCLKRSACQRPEAAKVAASHKSSARDLRARAWDKLRASGRGQVSACSAESRTWIAEDDSRMTSFGGLDCWTSWARVANLSGAKYVIHQPPAYESRVCSS